MREDVDLLDVGGEEIVQENPVIQNQAIKQDLFDTPQQQQPVNQFQQPQQTYPGTNVMNQNQGLNLNPNNQQQQQPQINSLVPNSNPLVPNMNQNAGGFTRYYYIVISYFFRISWKSTKSRKFDDTSTTTTISSEKGKHNEMF